MRLIDADELKNNLSAAIRKNNELKRALIDNDFETLIDDADTVDAEPVRHCPHCGAKMDLK